VRVERFYITKFKITPKIEGIDAKFKNRSNTDNMKRFTIPSVTESAPCFWGVLCA